MKAAKRPLEAVTALMAERRQFEAWIAALDAKRDGTPQHVFDRVKGDYTSRLNGVIEKLSSHAGDLEATATQLTERVAELAQQEQAKRDERAETELRSHVGELSEPDAQSALAACDTAIAESTASREETERELAQVRELLDAARGAPGESTPVLAEETEKPALPEEPVADLLAGPGAATDAESAASSAPTPPAGVATIEPNSMPAPTPAAASVPVPARSSGFDELAFLHSVTDPTPPTPAQASPAPSPAPAVLQAPAAAPAAAPVPAAPAPAVASPAPLVEHDESEPLEGALVSRAARPSVAQEFVREGDEDRSALQVPRSTDHMPRRSVEVPMSMNVTANNPIVLRQSSALEQPKTLKCSECGSMNYPTEWYCERCGAELASL
ncbi:MAG: hypothetical protein JWO05_2394 [Gemmatimonadetes bacterium]|nr:hypothetical protein [Gemmatimonadota bacterium]